MASRRQFLQSLLAAPYLVPRAAGASTLLRDPYLQNVQPTFATLHWATLSSARGQVRLRSASGVNRLIDATRTEFTPAETHLPYTYFLHTARLDSLSGDDTYSYSVIHDGVPLSTSEPRFRTTPSNPNRFLVIGDSGSGSEEQRRLTTRMEAEGASLLVHTGDLVYPEGTHEGYQERYFAAYRKLMCSLPFFPTPGNHDYYADLAAPYRAVHSFPDSSVPAEDIGRYYSFDWGNIHFISLDTNLPLEEVAAGQTRMLDWLDQDLGATRQFWRIVFFHHPPYAFGPNSGDPLSALVRQWIVPILEKHRVPLVLAGHEHNYQRTKPLRGAQPAIDGITYVTSGGGGAMLYEVHADPRLAAGASLHHYLRVQASGSRIAIEAVSLAGDTIDKGEILPGPMLRDGEDAILNAASNLPMLAPNTIASLYGWHYAPSTVSAPSTPLPSTLAGVRVFLNDVPLPLYLVSPQQINFQLPPDLTPSGPATLRVQSPNGSVERQILLHPAAPGIFTNPAGQAILSQEGDRATIYATGLGDLSHPVSILTPTSTITPTSVWPLPNAPGQFAITFQLPPNTPSLQLASAGICSNTAPLAPAHP